MNEEVLWIKNLLYEIAYGSTMSSDAAKILLNCIVEALQGQKGE